MSDPLSQALSGAGPHTVDSLSRRLPNFPREAIHGALEALVAQGVLTRESTEAGETAYRYAAPEKYVQADWEVIRNPAGPQGRRPR